MTDQRRSASVSTRRPSPPTPPDAAIDPTEDTELLGIPDPSVSTPPGGAASSGGGSASDHDLAADMARAKVRQRLFGGPLATTTVDRFQLLEPIGEGGMGTVFAAYDPRLDRKVAIKLVLVQGDRSVSEARQRLLQEAQVMAQLTHPHVVTVHEAGPYEAAPGDEGIFVAMEYIRGQTLKQWIREAAPAWPRVVEVFVQAGRGLAAAHRQGIVHRDFKPDNVMLDESEQARVLDFGLAKTIDSSPEAATTLERIGDEPLSSSRVNQLTRTGALLGTPRYMAPELFLGEPPDASTDQYAFCVSLWIALLGVHPFERRSLFRMHEAMLGDAPTVPDGSRIPSWVLQALRRGLAPRAADRWPSMTELLAALERDPARARRRRQVVGGLAVLLLGFVAGGLALQPATPPREDPAEDRACTGGPALRDRVWGPDERAAVEAAFLATDLQYAPRAWERAERALDDYAETWVEGHRDACEATEVRHEQTPAQLERRMTCLHRGWRALGSLVEVLAQADATTVDKASEAIEQLPSLDRCADLVLLSAEVEPPPADIATEVAQLDDRLVRAQVLATTGRLEEGQELAEATLTEAAALDHRPLLARAQLVVGDIRSTLAGAQEAEPMLVDAFVDASASGLPEVASSAAARLAYLVGVPLRREREALLWARLACMEADRHHDDSALARCWVSRGDVRVQSQDYDAAIEDFRQALAYYERTAGPTDVAVADVRRKLGNALGRARRFDEAVVEHERALELFEDARGPDHASVALSHGMLARLLWKKKDHERALVHAEQALEIFEGRLDPKHVNIGNAHYLLGNVLSALDRHEDALPHYGRAHTIKADHFGSEEHINVAIVDYDHANALLELDRFAEADAIYARVYEVFSGSQSTMRRHAATVLFSRGIAAKAMGRLADAVELTERGLLDAQEHGLELEHVAQARDWLARAMLELGRPKAQSLAMADRALADYQSLGAPLAKQREDLERWLREHR